MYENAGFEHPCGLPCEQPLTIPNIETAFSYARLLAHSMQVGLHYKSIICNIGTLAAYIGMKAAHWARLVIKIGAYIMNIELVFKTNLETLWAYIEKATAEHVVISRRDDGAFIIVGDVPTITRLLGALGGEMSGLVSFKALAQPVNERE